MSNWYWLAILGLVAWGLVELWERWEKRRVQPGSFRDWIRNRSWREHAAERLQEWKSVTVPDDLSDEQIREMVERIFDEKFDRINEKMLKLLGERAHPFLLEAMKDERVSRVFTDRDEYDPFEPKSPFQGICNVLEEGIPPSEAVPLVIPFASHELESFRDAADGILGRIGSNACIEPVSRLLHDSSNEDDDDKGSPVALATVRGIEDALKHDRFSPAFRTTVFNILAEEIQRPLSGLWPPHEYFDVLLGINHDQAVTLLLSPKLFTLEYEGLSRLAESLAGARVRVPREKLDPLLQAAKEKTSEYPYNKMYGELLKLSALNPTATTEHQLREATKLQADYVPQDAAQALKLLYHVGDPLNAIHRVHKQDGWHALRPEERLYSAVLDCDGNVHNGGFAQYFINCGEHWRTALTGLREIGAPPQAAVLEKALAFFGSKGAPETEDAMKSAIGKFSQRKLDQFNELDKEYYACPGDVMAILWVYLVDHRDKFRFEQDSERD